MQMLLHSYAYEQLQAVTPFIQDNSGTLHWQLEVRMAFMAHKAKSRHAPIKSPSSPRSQRKRRGPVSTTGISAYLPIKDHLVTFPVFDLVVEVL